MIIKGYWHTKTILGTFTCLAAVFRLRRNPGKLLQSIIQNYNLTQTISFINLNICSIPFILKMMCYFPLHKITNNKKLNIFNLK